MLLLHDEDEETPAQLEINTNSFDKLRKALEPINDDDLSSQLVILKVEKQGKYIQVQFNPVF